MRFLHVTMFLLAIASLTLDPSLAQDEDLDNYGDESISSPPMWDSPNESSLDRTWFPERESSPHPPAVNDEVAPVVSLSTLKAPKNAVNLYKKARLEIARGDQLDKARKHLEESLNIYPEFALAWHALGVVHAQSGHAAQARMAMTRAIAADPKYWRPYHVLAVVALEDQKYREAAAIAVEAFGVLAPVPLPLRLVFAQASLMLGNLKGAEWNARHIIQNDTLSELSEAHHILGVVLYARGDLQGTITQFQTFLRKTTDIRKADEIRKKIAIVEREAMTTASN